MKYIKWLWIVCLLLLLAVPTSSALAARGNPIDRILPGEDYVLEDGEVERGNVVILGGTAEIADGAILEGDLTVLGGDVEIAGTVEGNVTVFGGDVDVNESAWIDGDCVAIGGHVDIDENARIDGEIVTSPEGRWTWPFGERDRAIVPELPPVPELPELPRVPEVPRVVIERTPSAVSRVGSAFLSAIFVGVAALLITLIWPRHTDQVRRVIIRQPATSGLVGFLTFLSAGLLTPILAIISAVLLLICIGLLGFPLIVMIWLAIGAAALFGWAALGQIVGRWISERLHLQGTTLALEAGLGAATLTLTLGLMQVPPLLGIGGGLLQFIIVCLGLGAVILTRFGRQDYQSGQPILPQRRPKPAAPPAAPGQPAAPLPPEPPAPPEPDSGFDAPPLETEQPFPER